MLKKFGWPTFIIILIASIHLIFRQKTQKNPEGSKNIIVVGTNAQFPPYEFVQDDELQGFDIDLIHELEKILHKQFIIKDMPFTSLLLEAQNGSIHMVASAMTPTPDRIKKVLFTKPYLNKDPLVAVSLNGHPITSFDDLQNKKIVVNDGFTAESYMKERAEKYNIELLTVPTVTEAFLALTQRHADVYVSARNAIQPFFEKYGSEKFNIFKLDAMDEYAIAISQIYPELVDEIQKGLDLLHNSGVILTLKEKWGL